MPQDATDAPGCSSQTIKFEFSKKNLNLGQQLIENRDFNRLQIIARG
jgi:hypothetical protein